MKSADDFVVNDSLTFCDCTPKGDFLQMSLGLEVILDFGFIEFGGMSRVGGSNLPCSAAFGFPPTSVV